ncbi:MAG: GC-type dockerin domain-anchored protein [Phycisphaerales bacterium]|jgi:6-phosphogluconolactonase (cycloisomerase 2 family)|nr:GC-type dockerin domain-anchored protein [Phycisphaerales bacterium]
MPTHRFLSRMSAFGVAVPACALASAQATQPTCFIAHYYSLGGSVASITFDPNSGAAGLVDNAPAGIWTISLALSPSGRFLAASNAAGSSDGFPDLEDLRIFRVNADSTLTELLETKVPGSPLAMQWVDDRFLAILDTDLSGSTVGVYEFDEPLLTLVETDRASTGGFNADMCADPDQRLLYTQDTNAYVIRRWGVSGSGTLAYEGQISTLGVYPLDIKRSPDGAHLYAGGGISSDRNKILGFDINPIGSPAILSPIPGSPFISSGNSPAYLAIARDGAVLCMGHGTDATVRTFLVAPDGSLTETGFLFDIGLQGTIGDLDALGDLLLVTDDSTATDGVQGLYVFRVGADGSLTQIGSVISTGNTRPEGDLVIWRGLNAGCLADWDDSGGEPNSSDFLAYLNDWASNAPLADLAPPGGDGSWDSSDFLAFLNLYALGCE